MTKRNNIINALITHILASTSSQKGFRGVKFIDEINEFPAFYVYPKTEERFHISSNTRYGSISLEIRGMVMNETTPDAYARELEEAIQTFSYPSVQDTKVVQLATDEGILEPYAIVDIVALLLYEVTE